MKKNVVISAVNLFEGGPLSLLKDCLEFIENSNLVEEYNFYVFVHKIELFETQSYHNIKFVQFPKAKKSYLVRLFYEYYYFNKIAKKLNVFFWLSLHDITPNLGNIPQAVYCHNPSPFNLINFKDIYLQPTQFLFRLFYKYLYQINIKKNHYVIVQQNWIKSKFVEMFNLEASKVIVSLPKVSSNKRATETLNKGYSESKLFFFPTFPRPFKNIEVICEAVKIIEKNDFKFKVIITVDGSENNYSRSIIRKYKRNKNVEFIGLIDRESVYEYYYKVDCLIFPSKLETWGLPISEFKQFNKPMLVSGLPYAIETVSEYSYVKFFDPLNANQLANYMIDFINDDIKYDNTSAVKYEQPYVQNWNELFIKLFNN